MFVHKQCRSTGGFLPHLYPSPWLVCTDVQSKRFYKKDVRLSHRKLSSELRKPDISMRLIFRESF